MSISIHINFNGNCRDAFQFYAEQLDGTIGIILQFKDSPAATNVPAEWQHKIIHANISIRGIELSGADVLTTEYQKPIGFNLLLSVNTEMDVKSIYNKFEVGGETILSPQKTFWSPCYAIVVDQFGVPWKINCGT